MNGLVPHTSASSIISRNIYIDPSLLNDGSEKINFKWKNSRCALEYDENELEILFL